tara:strand:- start:17 stop:286 length:270 start_codon:yes stop_codon:yes gene_type:complete
MIGILAQKILKLIMPQMIEHFVGIFKSDRVLDYMELPNDADRRIDKLEEQIKLIIEDQHPPSIDLKEWEDVKDTIKKIKNKKVFKSLNG